MKTWTSTAVALGLGLAATAISSMSAMPVMFNRNFMAGNAKHSNRIAFNTVEMQPVPHYMLADAGLLGDELHPMCEYSEKNSTTYEGKATVLVAISKCLNDSSIELIKDWIETLRATEFVPGKDGIKKPLEFATVLLPGDCEARTERQKSGREDDTGYVATPVPGGEYAGKSPPTELLSADLSKHLLSREVHPDEVVRIQAFAKFGRVLAEAPTITSTVDVPIAVVSFSNNHNSYEYVAQYENRYSIKNAFNFQMCESGKNCDGVYENCVKLQENIELFMYNPFQIVRSFECNALEGSIPVTYVNAAGGRECYCRCPAGFENTTLTDAPNKCAKPDDQACPCVWNDGTKPIPHKMENTEYLDECKFTDLASRWNVAVPFPLDNYVSDERVNSEDDGEVTSGPHIDLVVTPLYKPVYKISQIKKWYRAKHPESGDFQRSELPHTDSFEPEAKPNRQPIEEPATSESFTWRVYQHNSQDKIDDIKLGAYGKYQLELAATDYSDKATCLGCVAVVDKFRPENTTQCPVRVCDNSTGQCGSSDRGNVEYTVDNLDTLNGLVDALYKFRSKARNDKCSSMRCDTATFSLRNWFESSATKLKYKNGKTCFSQQEIEADFKNSAAATTNPLMCQTAPNGVYQSETPVEANKCTRCCQYDVKLREWWTDYKCNYEYDIAQCSGNNDATSECDLKQCVVLKGDTLASVSASIKPSITEESKKVLAKLEGQGFQTHTQVHRALQCTGFGQADGTCDYTATLSDLLDVTVENKFGDKSADYVFWRYKVGDENWHPWNPSTTTSHTFATASSEITLEAWTACGRARKFFFYVHLHVHSGIKVCDYFDKMWYQTTVSRAEITDTLCAYPGSDFAELTFDYQANIGLKHKRDQLRMNVTNVKCTLNFANRTGAQILNVTGVSRDIIDRFAVELQNMDKTAATTTFNVSCEFTYIRHDLETFAQTCQREFTIQDCDLPTIDTPPGKCLYDDCAGQGKPGPYEVCGGNVVSATGSATYMNTAPSECCQSCVDMVSTCTTILDLPSDAKDTDIKRCVPEVPHGGYGNTGYGDTGYGDTGYGDTGYGNEYEPSYSDVDSEETSENGAYESMMLLAKATVTSHSAAMGLLAASAMVAVVALVAVRQRRAQAARDTMIVDDAYYPLLH